jgi:hypothetical protein
MHFITLMYTIVRYTQRSSASAGLYIKLCLNLSSLNGGHTWTFVGLTSAKFMYFVSMASPCLVSTFEL